MSEKTLKEIATEVWDALKALLEIHPTIVAELTAEHEQRNNRYNDWTGRFLAGLEVVQYQSMNAASKAQGITPAKIRRKLQYVQTGYCTNKFAKWVHNNPELFGKLVQRFGLYAWPHLAWNFYFLEDIRQETLEGIMPLVTHSEVAEVLSNRFATLREEIAAEKRKVTLQQRRLDLISYLMKRDDPELIERLEGVIWPTKENLRQHLVVGDIMQIRVEEIDFSVRTYNSLKKANLNTVSDLVNTTEEELMNIRNFGRSSLVEVKEKLDQFGLTIKGDVGPTDTY